MTALAVLDYLSVAIFALTGALVASRKQLDIVGFCFLSCLTAVGGGTMRDVLLGRHPIFWIADPSYIVIATLAAITVFFSAHLVESRYSWLVWLDTFALAVAVPAGAALAMRLEQPPLVTILMGVATGCFGGLMRDVVCAEVPLVLKQGELYATAAFAGAMAAIGTMALTGDSLLALGISALVTWVLRAGSLLFGWRLPVYRPRPPRS